MSDGITASPISALSGISLTAPGGIDPTANVAGSGLTSAVQPASGGGFQDILANAVNSLQSAQSASNTASIGAVTGNLDDIQNAEISAAQLQTTIQLYTTVASKAVDAFNQIMNMQA